MSNDMKELKVLWYIENYSYCCHKTGEGLFSPEFTPYSLRGIHWRLSLYPRAISDELEGDIFFFISASEDDDDTNFDGVKGQLSVLTTDGSTLASKEETFKKSRLILTTDEILLYKRADCLAQDTLIVQCRIWHNEGAVQPREQICIRTRIGICEISFMHVTEDFVSLKPNEKKTIEIKQASREELVLSCSLYLSDCACCDEKILVEIKPNNTDHKLSKCKLFILDKSGNKIECGEIDNRLDYAGKNVQILPLLLTRQNIFSKKSEYLSDDKLCLSCECSFSTGIDYEKIERAVFENPLVSKTENICIENKSAVSVCRGESVFKGVLVAILSFFWGIFVSYLWSD